MLSLGAIELLPPLPLFIAFALAGLALNFVPGADMTFVIASAARGGRRDGVVAALGIGGGTLVHICAAGLGLSAILASSQAAFDVIKWIGAAYLLYLAISLALTGHRAVSAGDARAPMSGWRLFRAAALVNILNPKVALFFLAFLPQFVDPKAVIPALQILCLGLWFDLVGTTVNVVIALVAAGTASKLRHVAWLGSAARYIAATAMGALALRLAFADRR
jgi:threonine/homoserine/homoserine lactone efflux protein